MYDATPSVVAQQGINSLLYVSPSSYYGLPVHTHIPTNAASPEVDAAIVPNPLACCALCTGGTSQSLYVDVSTTTQSGCPIFFMSYATGVGWVCQFHSDVATAAAPNSKASIAYVPK